MAMAEHVKETPGWKRLDGVDILTAVIPRHRPDAGEWEKGAAKTPATLGRLARAAAEHPADPATGFHPCEYRAMIFREHGCGGNHHPLRKCRDNSGRH